MGGRLEQDLVEKLQPKRMQYCMETLKGLGLSPKQIDDTELNVNINGKTCKLWPYSGWWSCKGLGSGRGIANLVNKIKENLDESGKSFYNEPMNTISIRSPRYKDGTVLLARYKIPCGQDVQVEIQYGTHKGLYLASNSAICSSKIESLKTRNGNSLSVRAVPLASMEKIA